MADFKDYEIIENKPQIKIILKAVEAKDLIAGDLNGLSDPYLVIPQGQPGILDLPPKSNRTKRQDKTLSPKWNESFVLELEPDHCNELKIEVYDYDYIGKDDFLGSGSVPLKWVKEDMKNFYDEWIPLSIEKTSKKTKEKEVTKKGSVHIMIRVLGFSNDIKEEPFTIIDPLPLHITKTFKPHKVGDNLKKNTSIILSDSYINIEFGWDKPKKEKFEFETSLVAFDKEASWEEYVYYYKTSGLNDAIKHSGIKVPNDKQTIQIDFDKLPEKISYLVVILYSEFDISLDKTKNIKIKIKNKKEKIAKCITDQAEECFGLLLGIFQKDPKLDFWSFTALAEPFRVGDIYTSMKCIQKLICKYSLNEEKSKMKFDNSKEKHPFMGEIIFKKNEWNKIKNKFIFVGLGFIKNSYNEILIDTSVFALDNQDNIIENLFPKKMKNKNESIVMYDELNKSKIPQAETDDTLLSIDFNKLDSKIATIIITIYCPIDNNFSTVYDVYIRLFERWGPIGIFPISEFSNQTNLIIMGQFRKLNNDWYFASKNIPINLEEFEEIDQDIVTFAKNNPIKLINRS